MSTDPCRRTGNRWVRKIAADWHEFQYDPWAAQQPDGVLTYSIFDPTDTFQIVRYPAKGERVSSTAFHGDSPDPFAHAGAVWVCTDGPPLTLHRLDATTLLEMATLELPNAWADPSSEQSDWVTEFVADGAEHLIVATWREGRKSDEGGRTSRCRAWRIEVETMAREYLPPLEVPHDGALSGRFVAQTGHWVTYQDKQPRIFDLRTGKEIKEHPRFAAKRIPRRPLIQKMPRGYIPIVPHVKAERLPEIPLALSIPYGDPPNGVWSTISSLGIGPRRYFELRSARRGWFGLAYLIDFTSEPAVVRELTGDLATLNEWMARQDAAMLVEHGLNLNELEDGRALVTQIIEPAPPGVNGGRGLVRLGTLTPTSTEVEWAGWVSLPPRSGPREYRQLMVRADDTGWYLRLSTNGLRDILDDEAESPPSFTHWTRIDPPAGLSAPLYRWLDEP